MKNKNKKNLENNTQNSNKKDELTIRDFKFTDKQNNFINIGLHKDTNIIICKSPAGTGKTLCSVFCALKKLQDKRTKNIFYVRNPIESSSKGLGFVPGEISDKMDWVIQPLKDQLNQLLPPSQINALLLENKIEGIPIGYLKGRTFINATLIVDEIEDLSTQELLLTMSRMGHHCTLFMIGDEKQANIKNSGFMKVYNAFNNEKAKANGIHCLEFTKEDCMRNKITQFIIETFENIK